jgi:hypothetical protein
MIFSYPSLQQDIHMNLLVQYTYQMNIFPHKYVKAGHISRTDLPFKACGIKLVYEILSVSKY